MNMLGDEAVALVANDPFLMDGHKMRWHMDRVAEYQMGKRMYGEKGERGGMKWHGIATLSPLRGLRPMRGGR